MKVHTIREDKEALIELRLTPDNYRVITHFMDLGDPLIYRTPFVFDTNKSRWEVNYLHTDGLPKMNRAERKQCSELISEFEKLPF